MSFLSTVANSLFGTPQLPAALETKATVSYPMTEMVGPSLRIVNDALSEYLTNKDCPVPLVFSTILANIQRAAKNIPWNAHKLRRDENGDKLPDSKAGKLIYAPNSRQSWEEFVAQYLGHYLSTGNVFIHITRSDIDKTPTQLKIMPTSTRIVGKNDWMADIEGYQVPGMNKTFLPDEVIHVKSFKLDDELYGNSPLAVAALNVESLIAAQKQRIKLLVNGGPSVAVYNDANDAAEDLTETQELELAQKINRNNKITFLPNKVNVVKLGLDPVNLDILNSLEFDANAIADLLGYPSILLSTGAEATYSNQDAVEKALYLNCVIPLMADLRSALNRGLGKSFKDEAYIDYDITEIKVIHPEQPELITALGEGWMTINEKRKKLGLSALPNKIGDGLVVPMGLTYYKSVDAIGSVEPTADTYDANDAGVGDE